MEDKVEEPRTDQVDHLSSLGVRIERKPLVGWLGQSDSWMEKRHNVEPIVSISHGSIWHVRLRPGRRRRWPVVIQA